MLSFCIFKVIPGFTGLLQPGGISQGKLLTPHSTPEAPESQAGTVLPLLSIPCKLSAAQLRKTPARSMEMPGPP